MSRYHSPRHLKKRKFPRLSLCLAAAVLLLAAAGTSLWSAAPLARYAVSTSGSDSARVARFYVGAKSTTANENLQLNANAKTAAYTLTVTNYTGNTVNEVTTAYDVVVTFPSRLSGVTLTLKNGTTTVPGTAAENNTVFTFANAGTFPAGTPRTDTLTLTFELSSGAQNNSWKNIEITANAAQQD